MPRKLCPLVLVDRVSDVGVGSLDEHLSTSRLRCSSPTRRCRSSRTLASHQPAQRSTSMNLPRTRSSTFLQLGHEVDEIIQLDRARSVDGDGLERFANGVVGVLSRGSGGGTSGEGGEDGGFGEAARRVEVD